VVRGPLISSRAQVYDAGVTLLLMYQRGSFFACVLEMRADAPLLDTYFPDLCNKKQGYFLHRRATLTNYNTLTEGSSCAATPTAL
jgi:hypothetical protein